MSIGTNNTLVSGVKLTTYTITEGDKTTITYYDTRSGISEEVGQTVTNAGGEALTSVLLKQSDEHITCEPFAFKKAASPPQV